MANPTIYVLQTKAATVEFYDGPPDADGNPTGNKVAITSAAAWSGTGASVVATGPEAANVTGETAGAGQVTVLEPVSGFTFSQPIDVLAAELSIRSARIVIP